MTRQPQVTQIARNNGQRDRAARAGGGLGGPSADGGQQQPGSQPVKVTHPGPVPNGYTILPLSHKPQAFKATGSIVKVWEGKKTASSYLIGQKTQVHFKKTCKNELSEQERTNF